jgi:hypothetical protein
MSVPPPDPPRESRTVAGSARTGRSSGTAARKGIATPPSLVGEFARRKQERRQRTFQQIARDWPGWSVSLFAHVVLLVVLATILMRDPREDQVLSFLSGFAERAAQPEQPDEPIEAAATVIERNTGEPVPSRATEAASAPSPKPVIRKPQEVAVAGNLASRAPERKRALLEESGGEPDRTEQAVATALQWLKRVQKEDGHWQLHAKNGRTDTDPGYPDGGTTVAKTDVGATALAVLCYLGAGHTHREGTYKKEVGEALDWLRKKQQPDGLVYDREFDGPAPLYAHAQATIALAEALAMTGDEALKPAVEKALAYIAEAQNPLTGGWKYRPRQPQSDLSVTGWQLMALQTGRMGGWEPPPAVLDGAAAFLTRVEANDGARYKYDEEPRSQPTPAMTAEGLLCRQYLGWPANHPSMLAGVEYLTSEELAPRWESGARNVYHWYYASQMLHNLQGDAWRGWQGRLVPVLADAQEKAGTVRGSWHPFRVTGHLDEHTSEGGRLYVTCLCVLILETPYRHQPLFSATPP